jgi:hypothetical protein
MLDKFSERSIWGKLGDTDLETICGKLKDFGVHTKS